jgi:hypothetical protein
VVRELGGNMVIEYDTGEYSVDIGFPGHRIAIEARACPGTAHIAMTPACLQPLQTHSLSVVCSASLDRLALAPSLPT